MLNEDKQSEQEWDNAIERARILGALEVLNSLYEDMTLRRDEARDESAREVYDEMLTVLASLENGYGRTRSTLPPVSDSQPS